MENCSDLADLEGIKQNDYLAMMGSSDSFFQLVQLVYNLNTTMYVSHLYAKIQMFVIVH
jgi:hypothetical protein